MVLLVGGLLALIMVAILLAVVVGGTGGLPIQVLSVVLHSLMFLKVWVVWWGYGMFPPSVPICTPPSQQPKLGVSFCEGGVYIGKL